MGQSDAVYVVSIDTQSKATHVVGIPRDTMTTIEIQTRMEIQLQSIQVR